MKRIVMWIKALRRPRRDKRVERFGGYPEAGPDMKIDHFEPALDQAERVSQTLNGVSRLGPESVDEATGYPLDNWVNAQGDEWERRLREQHQVFRARAQYRLRQAEAIVEQYQQLHEEDLVRLSNAEIAVETALLALSGHEPEPALRSPASAGRRIGAGAQRTHEKTPEPASSGELASASSATEWRDPPHVRAAFPKPRASRTELRHLLDPSDASRVPRWGEAGFRDGTLLAGRPRSTYLHVLALLLAAGADMGAFVQVVELVLPDQDWLDWLVVSGLTAVVLYLAHMIGVMLREARAAQPSDGGIAGRIGGWLGRRFGAFVCVVVWLALGLMAFWVRLTVPLPGTVQLGGGIGSGGIGSGGIGSGGIGSGVTASGGSGIGSSGIGGGSATSGTTTSSHTLQSAAVFLSLYLATGLVAAVGAYFAHNPYRGRYAAAIRAYRKASERAAASAYQLGQGVAVYEHQRAEIEASQLILAEATSQDKAFTERLKQSVRIEIASLARDPAVTDAIFEPDHKPYWRDPDGQPDGTQGGAPN